MWKTNYEDTKIAITKEMQRRNLGKDTQKKGLITLNQICKHCEKYHDTHLRDSSDVRSFFDFLHNVKKSNPCTINNYRSALKFIYTVVLKKEWDNFSFPYINRSTIKDIELPKSTDLHSHMTYEKACIKWSLKWSSMAWQPERKVLISGP